MPASRISSGNHTGLVLVWIPFILAQLLESTPVWSWWIAWSGSVLLLAMTLGGFVFRLPNDLPRLEQALRPWFITHVVFAVYTFITPVFYWLDLNGITFGMDQAAIHHTVELDLAAEAQRLYLLGHIGLVYGFAVGAGRPRVSTSQFVWRGDLAYFLVLFAIVSLVLFAVFAFMPGFGQFALKAKQSAIVSLAVGLGVAFKRRSNWLIPSVVANAAMLLLALSSGWKEEVFVLVLLIASTFLPYYPFVTTLLVALAFAFGFVVLPPIAATVRATAWREGESRVQAVERAFADLSTKSIAEFREDTWRFLTMRLSEASLFTKYLSATPEHVDFEGLQMLKQTALALVPRAIWPGKPVLEQQVMERVYSRDVVSRLSRVSAKPQFVVDGYLAGGAITLFLSLLIYGWICQAASVLCERKFGGYLLGGVVFNGLFGVLWRGNCWEFIAGALLWSFVMVFIFEAILRSQRIIAPVVMRY